VRDKWEWRLEESDLIGNEKNHLCDPHFVEMFRKHGTLSSSSSSFTRFQTETLPFTGLLFATASD